MTHCGGRKYLRQVLVYTKMHRNSQQFHTPQTMQFLSCSSVSVETVSKQQHPFNSPSSGTTQVSRYQKGKTNLDFTETRDNEWQWYLLGHMQICTSLQRDNHASTPPLIFYRIDALTAAQPTSSKPWSFFNYGRCSLILRDGTMGWI